LAFSKFSVFLNISNSLSSLLKKKKIIIKRYLFYLRLIY